MFPTPFHANMPDEILLNETAYVVWQTVKEQGPIELGEVARISGIDQAQVSAAATEAAKDGFFAVDEHKKDQITVSEDAQKLFEQGLPELRARDKLKQSGNEMPGLRQ